MGTLTDDRLIDQVEISVTSSTQADKDARVLGLNSWDVETGPTSAPALQSIKSDYHIRKHLGIPA